MGLDMYLEAESYISAYAFHPDYDERRQRFDAILENAGVLVEAIDASTPSLTVSVTVAYWRKANAIHAWFVRNVQGGVDECQRAYVPPSVLGLLRDTCKKVLADHALAESLLPTQSGFFFGSTEYGEWYFEDLKYTIEQIDRVLKFAEDHDLDLYYRASW